MPPPDPGHRNPIDPSLGGASLSAPWRLEYIESLPKDPAPSAPSPAPKPVDSSSSFLADYWAHPESDEHNHVILRTGSGPAAGMILLNAFPYANGHLLVALGDGRPTLLDYTPDQRAALWKLTDLAAALVQATLDPQGINIGINQGRAAGAGVPGHLHVHLVPRWNGDVNFMAAVGRIRVIPGSLDAMAKRYRAAWDGLRATWPT